MLKFFSQYQFIINVVFFLAIFYFIYFPSSRAKLQAENTYLRDYTDALEIQNKRQEELIKMKDERIKEQKRAYNELSDKHNELELMVGVIAKTINVDLDKVREDVRHDLAEKKRREKLDSLS